MTKRDYFNYFHMMKYQGTVPYGYKVFTLIYLVIGLSVTNYGADAIAKNIKNINLMEAYLLDFGNLVLYLILYLALYKILKDRFVDYFFRIFVPVQLLGLITTMCYVIFKTILKFQSGDLSILPKDNALDPIMFISPIVDIVLMTVPLIWALKKNDPNLTETAS